MPKVPQYNQQVSQSALPNIRQSANAPSEAFGGTASGAKVFQAAQGAIDALERERAKAEEIRITEAENRITQAKQRLFYDPENGAMTKKGKDAFGLNESHMSEFDKEVAAVEKELANPAQREKLKMRAQGHRQDLNNMINKHITQEAGKYDSEVTEASIALAQEEAVLNFTDPMKTTSAIERQKLELLKHADRNGLPPAWVEIKTKETESRTHSAIITRMVNANDPKLAKSYFEQNQDNFTTSDRAKIEPLLKESNYLGMAQEFTDNSMKQGKSLSAAVSEANKIEDAEQRKRTVSMLRTEYGAREADKELDNKRRYESMSVTLEKNKGDLSVIPKQALLSMSENQRQSLELRSRQLREGTKPQTDWVKYYDLKAMASNEATRNDFLKADLAELRPHLADSEFKEMVDLQTKAKSGDDSGIRGLSSEMQVANRTLEQAGIVTNPRTNKQRDIYARAMRAIDAEVMARRSQGEKVGPQQVQEITDALLIPGKLEVNWGFDKSVKAFELEPGQNIVVKIEDIPRSVRLKIEADLRKVNPKVIPTNDEIVSYYTAKLSRKVNSNAN